jgi:putative FmdB family regulatory protein
MPIYAYRCDACGHAKDVLQKVSDALLTVCPACGAQAFQKQVTAAGFQLKGSGWYVTDFKGNGQAKPSEGKGDSAAAASGSSSTGEGAAKGTDAPPAGKAGAAPAKSDATPAKPSGKADKPATGTGSGAAPA